MTPSHRLLAAALLVALALPPHPAFALRAGLEGRESEVRRALSATPGAGLEEPVREFESVEAFVKMLARRKIPLSAGQRQMVEHAQSQAGEVLDVPTPVPPSVKGNWTVVETVLHPDAATTGPDERKFNLTVDRWTREAGVARVGLRFESITPDKLSILDQYVDKPLVVEIGVKDRPVIGRIPMLRINDIESLDALTFAQVYAVARHRTLLRAKSWPPVVAVLNYTDEQGRPRTAFFL